MDYEKKYEKLVDAVKVLRDNNPSDEGIQNWVNDNVPELKEESEDEKIRKAIINIFATHKDYEVYFGVSVEDILAWLEKQGEKEEPQVYETGDGEAITYSESEGYKVLEPKFKVGDWIVDKSGLAQQVLDFRGGIYTCTYNSFTTDCESNYHLWTIQDAKDGDVLFHSDSASNGIFIFKELLKYEFSEEVMCYCDYDSEDHFCLGEHHTCCWADAKILHPATKEQRDLLFQKMNEAGYMWDADKKELNVETKFKVGDRIYEWDDEKKVLKKIDVITHLFNVGDTIIKKSNSDINDFGQFTITDITGGKYWYNDRIICDITEQDKWEIYESVRKNPWGEEDENMLKSIIATCELAELDRDSSPARHLFEMQANWLKSLKERIKGGH